MSRPRVGFSGLLIGSVLLVCVACFPLGSRAALTREHGPELQAAFEAYSSAVADAYETGDTSRLTDVAVGYPLRNHLEVSEYENARTSAEWWKTVVLSLEVTKYSPEAAEILVRLKAIGDVSVTSEQDREYSRLVSFQKVDNVWKVSSYQSVPAQ